MQWLELLSLGHINLDEIDIHILLIHEILHNVVNRNECCFEVLITFLPLHMKSFYEFKLD